MDSSAAFSAAARGGSPALRGCLAAGLQQRRRAAAVRWATLNTLLLAVLLYDLWHKCPGYTSPLHALELALAALLAGAALWHGAQLAAAARARLPVSTLQRRLLGLRRARLDSSFRLLDSSDGSSRSSAGGGSLGDGCGPEELSALSLSRSWGSAGSGEPAAPRAAPLTPPPPDRFIADTDSLTEYLSRYEEVRAAEEAAARGAWPACTGPTGGRGWPACTGLAAGGTVPRGYQLAAPEEDSGAAGEAGAAGAGAGAGAGARHVWRRLDVDPQQLTTYNLNLRVWLHVTIFERLVREMASVDEALANHHLPDVKLGEVSAERLRKTAAGALAQQHLPSLRALLPFLEPFPAQRYVVQRIKELARGGALSGYRWDRGGPDWDPSKPTDAELVFHLFVTYMDASCGAPGEEAPFSSRHVGTLGARARPVGPGPALLRAGARPPHWALRLGGDTLSLPPGRANLLHSLLLLLAALRRAAGPAGLAGPAARAPLGPHALNLLWVIGGEAPVPPSRAAPLDMDIQ